mmetsp:Transcript_11530/g.26702  ORF Transcript_11530/g.26702 Transcript_11530/m.26702 type:complete len:161 (-) Transcript_11530:166-648(-)
MLFDGLSNLCLYKETRKMRRKHLSVARAWIKMIDRLAGTAPDFCLGKLFLLKAELASVSRRKNNYDVVKFYKCAIALCQKGGLLMEEAIANERTGKYFASVGKEIEAQPHLEQACQLYQKWGAGGKVAKLRVDASKVLKLKGSLGSPTVDSRNLSPDYLS